MEGMETCLGAAHPAENPTGLDVFFAPRSIAFIGVSQRPFSPASRGLRNAVRLGYGGKLFPINPRYDEIHGVRCYSTLDAVPGEVDLAMIALSAEATLDVVGQCRDKGVKGIVVCSSGWGEVGGEGAARAERLDALLRRTGIRLLGPNSLGVGSTASRVCLGYNSSFEEVKFPRVGRIGLVSQSGAMLGGLVLNAEELGADLAMLAHVGNAQDVTSEELAAYMLRSADVDVVAMMIEGVRDPVAFVDCARLARDLGKSLVVFKAGRSELGRSAVQSHTGALAGSDAVFSAVCREEGVIRVGESEDLLPTAALIAHWKRRSAVRTGRVLVFTLSGGAASIIADHAETLGLSIPPLSSRTAARLTEILPFYTRPANPFDVGGGVFSDSTLPKRALEACVDDENSEAVVWVSVGAPRDERSNQLLNEALDLAVVAKKPFLVVPTSGHPQEAGFERCRKLGIPVASSIRSAMAMIAAAVAAQRAVDPAGSTAGADPVLLPDGEFDEAMAKRLLRDIGIPVPQGEVVADQEAAVAAAEAIGYPVAMKGVAAGVHHKSELGLVRLRIVDATDARNAAQDLLGRLERLGGGRILVEKMAALDEATEVVLGVNNDPQFGPMLMVGLGGVAVELFGDVAFGRCPTSRERAQAMIDRTRLGRLLRGFRGRPPGDLDGLLDAMVRLSRLAAAHADSIAEIDVNPVLVGRRGEGVLALDAVIIRKDGRP